MINIPPVPFFIMIYLLLARFMGVLLISIVACKAFAEFFPNIFWLNRFIDRVPVIHFTASTKKLLLFFTISLWVGTLIPFLQTICYLLPVCVPNVSTTIIPASIAIGTNNLLAGIILYIIYYTKEPMPEFDNEAVKDIKKSLKTIGEQTKRAELRSNEIDKNTEKGQGRVMRGRTGTKRKI